MHYLEIKYNNKTSKKNNFLESVFLGVLGFILPMANPDFEEKIDDVINWLIEFDEEGVPVREIGLDENRKIIMKMPYKKNYGYWTDNNMLYEDFKENFENKEISKEYFDEEWDDL